MQKIYYLKLSFRPVFPMYGTIDRNIWIDNDQVMFTSALNCRSYLVDREGIREVKTIIALEMLQ